MSYCQGCADLSAALARAEQERDDWQTVALARHEDVVKVYEAKLDAAAETRRSLLAYVQHKPGCAVDLWEHIAVLTKQRPDCTCGLASLLLVVEGRDETKGEADTRVDGQK